MESAAANFTGDSMPVDFALFMLSSRMESSMCLLWRNMASAMESIFVVSGPAACRESCLMPAIWDKRVSGPNVSARAVVSFVFFRFLSFPANGALEPAMTRRKAKSMINTVDFFLTLSL